MTDQKTNRTQLWKLLGLLIFLAVVTTGLIASKLLISDTNLESIQVMSEPNANQNSSTQLDILFLYQENQLKGLPEDAETWFKNRDQYITHLWTSADLISLDLPPSFLIENVDLPERHHKAKQIIAYANYLSVEGKKRQLLSPFNKPLLRLKSDRITIEEQAK